LNIFHNRNRIFAGQKFAFARKNERLVRQLTELSNKSIAPSLFVCYTGDMTIEDIALLCKKRSVRWTSHILQRMFRRGICMDDVTDVLENGGIMAYYRVFSQPC
jgi:hypothetical protein